MVAADGNGDGVNDVLPDNILLVYDAGARVVYLDRKPNYYPAKVVPEPATVTLSLLALAALATRRRKK